MRTVRGVVLAALTAFWFSGCEAGGCSGSDDLDEPYCGDLVPAWAGPALPGYAPLTTPEIETIIGQSVEQSTALGALAVTAVVDRDGFVLAVYQMTGAPAGPAFPVPATAAPDAAPGVNAAIAKARTAAFLSSDQNAFSSRTAAFIVDQHFPPGIQFTPGGPLFGVQNSNDTGSDIVRGIGPNSVNPSPLPDPNGFSGLAGGVPIYKDRRVVGGVGVSGNVAAADEKAAIAATRGFYPPHDIRACEMFVDGIRLDFARPEFPYVTPTLAFAALPGALVTGITPGAPRPVFPAATFGGVSGELLYSVIDSPLVPVPKLLAADVTRIIGQGAAAANTLRAAIRLPLGTRAKTTIVVVDTAGNVLGAWRPPDNTLFSFDVAAQKARTAAAYSDATSTAALGEPLPGLTPGVALSTRAIGFMAQPFYPPGIEGTLPGPLFGVQDALPGGLGAGIPGLDVTPGAIGDATDGNGITIFPGGLPLYKAGVLVGGVGVSGDGVDQDDFVAFYGAEGFEPPAGLRCDGYEVRGIRLPWVKFPRNPTGGTQ
ncbi:MAG TPA: heme-binding protein [Planctomycetota bacterium]